MTTKKEVSLITGAKDFNALLAPINKRGAKLDPKALLKAETLLSDLKQGTDTANVDPLKAAK